MLIESCVFCDKCRGQRGAVIRFEPLHPVTPGHMLFVPRTHVENAGDNPVVTGIVMEAAARWAAEHHTDYNLITSAGSLATQTVFHLHVHVVPRKPNDGLHLPWTGQKRPQEV